ncbi:MAG: energy-coupling factor ABC transporter permease [Lachnospiraceae bacterium]|nr:energy-coupling factor ABC transporter permease [Lachnospiraceae bacterium]
MHMADALVVPAVAGVMSACSMGAAGFSVKKIKKEEEEKKIPVMGVMGAFVFAAQMINFTIPGTGSSGHLCGGMMLTALLGPFKGFLTMIGVLLIQCLIFADGGLMALGCNVWNMAFYGCFLGAFIWKFIMKNGADKKKIVAASLLGCVLTLQLGAFSVVLETYASGVTKLPFRAFLSLMQPIHLAIGAVEGLITSTVLVFIYQTRQELLWGIGGSFEKNTSKHSRKVIPVLLLTTILLAGGLSLFASSKPDGLEWSIEKLTGSTEISGSETTAEAIQNHTAIFPDYSLKDKDMAIGTSISGIVGACLVLALCVGTAWIFRIYKNQKDRKQEEKVYEQNR